MILYSKRTISSLRELGMSVEEGGVCPFVITTNLGSKTKRLKYIHPDRKKLRTGVDISEVNNLK